MKLVAYRRVSTPGQVTDGLGLDVQKARIREWAKAAGHRVIEWQEDPGITGTKDEAGRPGILAVLKAVRDGQAEGVIMTDLGRLSRLLTVQEAILAKVWEYGGHLFTVESGEVLPDDPDDPMRTAMRQMAGVFFQLERAMIIKRLRNGRTEKARQGGYAGFGSPAFGLRSVDKELVTDETEQAAAARITALRDEGKSLREIIAVLDAEGIRAKRGGGWSPSTVSRVLTRAGRR